MKFYCSIIVALFSSFSIGQTVTLVAAIQSPASETSGMIFINGKLITHNDSGGEAKLYELDSLTGDVTRSVFVENATNVDWEDICSDEQYIYIADFGNNNGTRTDLKIYRISISDYLLNTNDTVLAESINFSYSEQSTFTPSPFSTNFDAEALIAYSDSLYIFTKNWGNNWTSIYALSKEPGVYQVSKIDSINVQGLITGGTYNENQSKISLSGYTFTSPFIVEVSGFVTNSFSSGTIERYPLAVPSGFSMQIESISHTPTNQYYLTSEEHNLNSAAIYRLNLNSIASSENIDQKVECYPNPTDDIIEIKCNDFQKAEIYGLNGELIKTFNDSILNISDLSCGIYMLYLIDSFGKIVFSEKIVVM